MVQRTLTDQPEHTLPKRVGAWYRENFLIKQSIHFRRGLIYGTEDTYWSNRAYTSVDGWCMVQTTLTDQTEHTLLMRVGVWNRQHLLIKQSIHFCRWLVYGTENTNWSNRAYTSDDGWCMVQKTLTYQTEHTLPKRVGAWYRKQLLIKQSIHFWRRLVYGTEDTYWSNRASINFRRGLVYGIENTYWSNRAYTSDEGLMYGTENTYWSNRAYISVDGWCMVHRTLTDQIEHTLLMIGVKYR